MEGWSVNTFKLINKAGEERLVKFHFACNQGLKNMTDPEAQAAGAFLCLSNLLLCAYACQIDM